MFLTKSRCRPIVENVNLNHLQLVQFDHNRVCTCSIMFFSQFHLISQWHTKRPFFFFFKITIIWRQFTNLWFLLRHLSKHYSFFFYVFINLFSLLLQVSILHCHCVWMLLCCEALLQVSDSSEFAILYWVSPEFIWRPNVCHVYFLKQFFRLRVHLLHTWITKRLPFTVCWFALYSYFQLMSVVV